MTKLSNKAYIEFLMAITLEVSEFCVIIEQFFKKKNINPDKYGIDIIDINNIQEKITNAIDRHIVVNLGYQKSISEIDMVKLKYFKDSFGNFKNRVYEDTINFKKNSTTYWSATCPINTYSVFSKKTSDFVQRYEDIITNWTKNYTPMIEKQMIGSQVPQASQAPIPTEATNKNKI